jgi:uncharacterized protein YegL
MEGDMPKKDHTEIICVIDRSGSMSSIKTDAIGGFNTFLEEQKKEEGTASVSLVLFNTEYEMPVNNVEISKVEPLTNKTFVPAGSTALLDAVGKTINEVGARLSKTEESERPENVIICILTDGEENSSREFTLPKIKEMIEHQRKVYDWEFIFLAANQDAFAEAGRMGISADSTSNFFASSEGTKEAYTKMCEMTSVFRKKKVSK